MAAAFLTQLLRNENVVQPTSNERCIICLTECGTLCSESGVVEWLIRLPCNHTVGSNCIAKWLGPTGAANNSCPYCRAVFFPATPRPYLEHGIMDTADLVIQDPDAGDMVMWDPDTREYFIQEASISVTRMGNDEDGPEGGEMIEDPAEEPEPVTRDPNRSVADLETIKDMCETYCYRLDLDANPMLMHISQHFARKVYNTCRLVAPSRECIAAVSVLSISRLMGAPRTLNRVSNMSGVDSAEIDRLHRHIWGGPIVSYLVNEELVSMIVWGMGYGPGARGS